MNKFQVRPMDSNSAPNSNPELIKDSTPTTFKESNPSLNFNDNTIGFNAPVLLIRS